MWLLVRVRAALQRRCGRSERSICFPGDRGMVVVVKDVSIDVVHTGTGGCEMCACCIGRKGRGCAVCSEVRCWCGADVRAVLQGNAMSTTIATTKVVGF